MSYLPQGALTPEEKEAFSVSLEEIRSLSPQERLGFRLRQREAKAAERSAFWDAVAAAVPVAIALGVGTWLGGKKK